ncbi:hypothetical protein PVAND_016518 [Polypedilum vanderplanki]|nr:hypothetical protein PVAND_016518 [Polypedilum vanderplanki]
MLKASLYLPFFGDHENFMPEIAKLMTSVFENNESILKTAIENEKIEMCEFLIKNFKNLFTFMPFDHRKSIVNLVHEKNMDEILLKLLKIDFPFPDFKSKILSQEINDLLNDREKFKFDNIDYIKEFIEILREDENNFLRYAYDKENKSALLCALEKGKFKTYSFLKSQGFNFDKKEYSQICKKLKEMSPEKVNNFKIENAYNTQDNENYHLRLLANKFVIFGFYDNQKKLRDKFNIIFKYLKDLNRISEIRPILKFCAQIEKLKITMDFENEFIFDLDPSAIDCFGSADSSSLVFVAAGRTEQEIKETIIHECCHVVVNEYYENDFKPYFSFDIENKEKFEEIVKEIKISVNGVDDGCNKIISSVFEKYDDDQHDCELIVRVLSILASILAFYGNKNKINELRKRYKDLFDFSQKFITDKISIEEIKKRNRVRSLNKYLDLLQDIELNMTQLKLSNHKNRTQKLKKIIRSVNNYLIVTNVPILLLINLHNCLQNLQSSLYDAKNIFIFPKSLGNDQKYKDLQNIIENRSSEFPLRLIVNFSEGKNVRAVQSDLKSIFISSSDQQEEIQTFLTENDVEFEILKIEFKWNDLTQFCQENLLKSEIKFQEKKMSLDQLINNIIINDDTILNELLFDLCYNNSISINLTEKFSEEYFIERNFLIAPKNSKLKIQPKAVMQKQTFEQNFNKVLKSNELKIHIQNIFEYDFDQVLELTKDEKIILISDIGGSGKSRILNKIFNFFYETTDKWMIFINLRGYLNEFQKWNNQMTFLDFFNNFLSTKTREFERKIFHEFYNQGKVKILMDGFDEISPKCKDSVIEVIKSVMKSENQLWLTTRIHHEENLEHFNPKMIFSLKQLEIKKQKEFLVKYWTFKNIKNVSLQEKAEKLVSKLEKFTKKFRLINVIGMMQQLRIFADISIVNDDFNSDFFENLSMYDIYEQSVMNYIKIWKSSPLGEEEDTKLLSGINKAPNFRTIHQYYALLEYFQESVIKDFFKNEGEIWEFESVARGGIITYDKVTKKTIFIHSTYVDFFVANFILQTLSCKPNNQEFLNFAQILFEILCNIRFSVIAMFLNDKISTIKISDAIIGHLAEIINQNVGLDFFQHCIFNNYENNFDFIVNIIRKVDSEKRKKMFTYPLYQCLHSPIINENILDKVLKLYTEFFSYEEIIEILKSSCFNFYTITLYFQKPSVDYTIVKKIMTEIIKWSKNKKEDIKPILFGMFNVLYSPSLHSVIAQANDDDFKKFEYFWKLHEDYLTIDEMEKIIFKEILFAVAKGNSSKIFKYIYAKIKENPKLNFIDMFKKFSKEFAKNNKLENHKSLWECIELEKKSKNLKFDQLMLEKFDNINNYLQLVVIFNQSTEVLKFTISQIVKNTKNYPEILMSKNEENINLLYLLVIYNKDLDFMVTLMALLIEYLGNKNLKLLFSDMINTGENFFTLALNKGNITEIHEIHQMLVELKFSVDELKCLLANENGNVKNFLIGPTKFNLDCGVHKYLWWLADLYFKNDLKTLITEPNNESYNILQIAVAYNTIEVIELIWSKIKNYFNSVDKEKKYLMKRCNKGKNLYEIAKTRNKFNAKKWVLKVFDEYNITIVNL